MTPPLLRPPRALAAQFLLLPAIVGAAPLSAACERVWQASLKRLEAPQFHLVQTLEGDTVETVKAGSRLLMRESAQQPWRSAPAGIAPLRQAVKQTAGWLQRCEKLGAGETVEGAATDIYRFTLQTPMGTDPDNRVWIGRDNGLPYREEGGAARGTTRYTVIPRLP
ncbi:MAG: hypothetical protein LW854_17010 [Rubrivivax sp.]|jgi:hypothetical protein|nr:hypothetical protein [Rubrivivax sp.]